MITHDDHHQPSNKNSTPPSVPGQWGFNPTQEFENLGAVITVSGENSSSSTQSKSSTNTSDKETLSSSDRHVTGGTEERKQK
ncbi:hypothetical protein L1987_38934 [Smallanthus sonchifolius]|uniref:Uncharacterized protein n=1 Tax=Smallanthus sonchifolius TaxID=185202 RepID=A0ACB9HKF8_9ASTR|nr:hypothetical protein L1987_38934 [Smallanthus sonchifolius]